MPADGLQKSDNQDKWKKRTEVNQKDGKTFSRRNNWKQNVTALHMA